jgi:hypothetical protein
MHYTHYAPCLAGTHNLCTMHYTLRAAPCLATLYSLCTHYTLRAAPRLAGTVHYAPCTILIAAPRLAGTHNLCTMHYTLYSLCTILTMHYTHYALCLAGTHNLCTIHYTHHALYSLYLYTAPCLAGYRSTVLPTVLRAILTMHHVSQDIEVLYYLLYEELYSLCTMSRRI